MLTSPNMLPPAVLLEEKEKSKKMINYFDGNWLSQHNFWKFEIFETEIDTTSRN